MVTSLGDCGTMLPSFFITSNSARLGWTGICSLCSRPPTTRSMASLGRTHIFIPNRAPATAMAKNITMVIKMGMTLNLDFHDLLHDEVADNLQRHGRAQHNVADVVGEEELDVIRIGVEHENRHRDGNQAERGGRHAAMRADGPDASAELEALADHVGQLVQNLSQVAARALLQQHGRNEEVDIERRDA